MSMSWDSETCAYCTGMHWYAFFLPTVSWAGLMLPDVNQDFLITCVVLGIWSNAFVSMA